jgi:hypothetical protein
LSLYFRVHFKEYFLNGAPLGSVGSSLAKVRRKLNPTPVKKLPESQEEQTKKTTTQPFQCKMVTKSKRFLCFDCS